jgi:NNP family nitrate/nitrite transporter-like MFS transporter
MMLGVTGISIREQLGLDSTQFGVLTAMPVFTEALL